jgi:hypothetical protein
MLTICVINGQRQSYDAEVTHRCRARHLLYEELARMVPGLIHSEQMCWFRTRNKNANPTGTCLFDGAKLEVNIAAATCAPEFGLCFPRGSFVTERERLDIDMGVDLPMPMSGDWAGWTRREPLDSDRLRVNRKGWEVLYFLQPPSTHFDVTFTDLRAELCYTLQIEDGRRISLAAGPFYWGPDFKEDGLGLYSSYFNTDMVIDSRHMKTTRGSALITVLENSVLPGEP